MNKKLTVITPRENVAYCVLSPEKDYEKQLEELFDIHGHGLCVVFDGKTVKVRDYFCDETMGTFEVLSFEDCEDEVVLSWQNLENSTEKETLE